MCNWLGLTPLACQRGVELVALPHGVGVVAPTYWRARQAATQLKVEWTDLPLASESTDSINAKMLASLDNDADQKAETEGDVVDGQLRGQGGLRVSMGARRGMSPA